MPPFQLIGYTATALIGAASQGADDAGNGGYFGIAAIISAVFLGAGTFIGTAVTNYIKLRAIQERNKKHRRPSQSELLRRRAEINKQLEQLQAAEEDP